MRVYVYMYTHRRADCLDTTAKDLYTVRPTADQPVVRV